MLNTSKINSAFLLFSKREIFNYCCINVHLYRPFGAEVSKGAHTVKLSSAAEIKVFLFCGMLIVT